MASYGVLEEHTTLDPDFSILAFAFCWACGLSWNEAWANVKSSLLDKPMSRPLLIHPWIPHIQEKVLSRS
jgi:hypothetical protein